MRSRNTNVRSKVVALLVSLTALWAFAAYVTVREGLNMLWVTVTASNIGLPLADLNLALEQERKYSVAFVSGQDSVAEQLTAARARVDTVMTELRTRAAKGTVRWASSDELEQRLADFEVAFGAVADLRTDVNDRAIGRLEVVERYNAIVDSAFLVNRSLASWDDKEMARTTAGLVNLVYARELMAREDAIISGAVIVGELTPADRAAFIQTVGTRRYLHSEAVNQLTGDLRTQLEEVRASAAYRQLESVENMIMGAREGLGVGPETWQNAAGPMILSLRAFEEASVETTIDQATPVVIGTVLRLVLLGVLGLAAVIASIVISITTARNLVRQLERLRNAARDLASYRLPRVVERLQQGEQVDVKQEAPPLEFGTDEIGQVGEAFNQVQETAIRVAVEQAELRRSVRDVFLSLARRSQALLHRQLGLLDAMERRATDSEELAELFRIDHLATRMRRNAENLIVLSGATAGRAWRKPVPMVDVLRGALAEVEDYTRVTVLPVGNASLLGRAVGDVIHLLAELIENAVSFSPPQTTVRVGGSVVGYGFAIEIEDRGLGMSPEELAAANEQLRDPPEFRLTSTARLGLYVVAKLAERHGIRVRLTESAYGGTTAIVLLPGSIMADDGTEGGAPVDPGQLDSYRPAQLAGAGRHRLQTDTADRARGEAATAVAVRDASGVGLAADPAVADPTSGSNGTNGRGPVALAATTPLGGRGPDLPVRPSTAPTEPAAPTSSAVPAPPTQAAPEPPKLTPSGLPWRQRRATAEPPAASPATEPPRPASPARDPDATRSLMASYRSGTLRGRSDAARMAEEQAEDPPPPTTDPAAAQGPQDPQWTEPAQPPRPGSEPPLWTESMHQLRETEEGG